MIDIENAVFNQVADAFDAAYPNGSRYSEATTSPPRFPCLTLEQVDSYTYTGSLDADHKEHDAWVVLEVNVYSNLTAGAKQQAKTVMELVDQQLQGLNFTRMFCNPARNADKKYFRLTARYQAVVSENYIIYRR